MENSKYLISQLNTSSPIFAPIGGGSNANPITNGGYVLAIYDNNDLNVFTGNFNSYGINIFSMLYNNDIKEDYFIRAIKNLRKKNEYLQLTLQFEQELISDDEFYDELDNNEDKYLIKIDHSFDNSKFKYINQIIQKLDSDFSSDEIAEMFSVPIESVNQYIDCHLKELRG
jgi:hypothetical protein